MTDKPKQWPAWAKFRAVDCDGAAYYYEFEPELVGGYYSNGGRIERDWPEETHEPTLERRP